MIRQGRETGVGVFLHARHEFRSGDRRPFSQRHLLFVVRPPAAQGGRVTAPPKLRHERLLASVLVEVNFVQRKWLKQGDGSTVR